MFHVQRLVGKWVGRLSALSLLPGCDTARARPALEIEAASRATGESALTPGAVAGSSAALSLASTAVAPAARAPQPAVAFVNGCPEEMASFSDYCIDRYEAQLARWSDGHWLPHSPYEPVAPGELLEARSAAGSVPQAYINRNEAAAACQRAGKRLCSAREWFKACQGSERSAFPYGPSYTPHRCNSGKVHVLSQLFGANPKHWSYENFNSPRLNQEPGFLAKSGEYSACVSPSGAYDMVGNLHEWVADDVSENLPRQMPVASNLQSTLRRHRGNGIFLGGFYSTLFEHGRGCEFVTLAHEPSYHDYSTGFRCCRERKP